MKEKRLLLILCTLSTALFIGFSLWLYMQEGAYKQIADIGFTPIENKFNIEILADGINVETYIRYGEADLTVRKNVEAGHTTIWLEGNVPEEQLRKPMALQFVSDTEKREGQWGILSTDGIASAYCRVAAEENDIRSAYVVISCVITALIWFSTVNIRYFNRRKKVSEYAVCLLEKLENCNEKGNSSKEGQLFYETYAKQTFIEKILEVTVVWAGVLWLYRELYHPSLLQKLGLFILCVIAAFFIICGRTIHRNHLLLHPLIKENRPLSASVAFFKEAIYGKKSRKIRDVALYNASVSLLHSGCYEEAFELSKSVDESSKHYSWDYFALLRSILRNECFLNLGYREEAEREALKEEMMLEENPSLRKKKILFRMSVVKIRRMADSDEWEQTEESCEDYLRQCRDNYHRLPILFYLAQIKDKMGKTGEAEKLRETILTFSPENQVVRETMQFGTCSYVPEKIKYRDPLGVFLNGVYIVLIIMILGTLSS